jgi:hypothetical protein
VSVAVLNPVKQSTVEIGDAELDFAKANLSIALLSSTTRCPQAEHPFGLSGMIFANYADENKTRDMRPAASGTALSKRTLLTRIFIVGLLDLI